MDTARHNTSPTTTGNDERPTEHLLAGPAYITQEQAKPIYSAINPQC